MRKLFRREITFHTYLPKVTNEFSIPGLAKLLMYGNYVKARSIAESRTVRQVVEQELDLFPYRKKSDFLDPYFPPVDISYKHTNFNPALTDAGVCQVLNGDSLLSTFASSSRIDQLQYSLDPRQAPVKPKNITGTGKISQMTMWLDASYKHYDTMDSFENREGSIIVAINAWQTYYDVRINQLDLRAGTDVVIKVEPVVHSTSSEFKTLKLDERKCRYSDEIEVLKDFKSFVS